jgi:hypothetical protein
LIFQYWIWILFVLSILNMDFIWSFNIEYGFYLFFQYWIWILFVLSILNMDFICSFNIEYGLFVFCHERKLKVDRLVIRKSFLFLSYLRLFILILTLDNLTLSLWEYSFEIIFLLSNSCNVVGRARRGKADFKGLRHQNSG